MSNNEINIAVLGATPKAGRFANQAVNLLKDHGYRVIPVHPKFDTIEDLPVANSLADIKESVHTLTLYLGPQRLEPLTDEILALKPSRVIFNPGTESSKVQNALTDAGIDWCEACTLVMLQSNRFLA